MPAIDAISTATQAAGRARPARAGRRAVLLATLATLGAASGAHAFGLEQLTIIASEMAGYRTLVTVAARPASAADTNAREPGLVSEDRSRMDLSRLPLSSFGDADEPAR